MVIAGIADLNWLYIGIATAGGMLLGAFWYSPLLLGKQWMRASKLSKKDIARDNASTATYIKAAVGHFIAAIALAELIMLAGATGLREGVQLGLIVGIGLFFALQTVHLAFHGNKVLAFINSSYDLVVVVLMAGIIGLGR